MAYAAGHRRILIALATGGGKTRVAVEIVLGHVARGGRVLWLAHLHELLDQARGAIRAAGGDFDRITVESVQSRPRGEYSAVVIDEAHHTAARTYREVLASVAPALTIGCTATPSRLDGVALGECYSVIVAGPHPRELVRAGVLVPTRVVAPVRAPGRSLADHPVDAYRQWCDGRKAIVFACSVQHAAALASEFTVAGYPAASLDGRTQDRAGISARFASGELRVLTTYRLIGEGYDVPDCGAIILASRTTSPAMLLQMAGRGKRAAPGKADEVFVDLTGTCESLDIHPDDDMIYSLEGTPIRAAGELEAIRQCPECGAYSRQPEWAERRCPLCGFVVPSRPDPRVIRARLEERERLALAARVDALVRRRAPTAAFLATCWGQGHKSRFHRQFGRWPSAAELRAGERLAGHA